MKYFLSIVLIAFLASCSAPKYTYRFPASTGPVISKEQPSEKNIEKTSEASGNLVASANPKSSVVLSESLADAKPELKKNIPSVAKTLKAVKKVAKNTRNEIRSAVAPNPDSLDDDLKLAILFGVVGIVSLVLLILSKLFGILGGIFLIIATLYFVKWFLAQ